MRGCTSGGWVIAPAMVAGLCCLGLLTLVLLFANSSLIVWGRSGSNRTPCCKRENQTNGEGDCVHTVGVWSQNKKMIASDWDFRRFGFGLEKCSFSNSIYISFLFRTRCRESWWVNLIRRNVNILLQWKQTFWMRINCFNLGHWRRKKERKKEKRERLFDCVQSCQSNLRKLMCICKKKSHL